MATAYEILTRIAPQASVLAALGVGTDCDAVVSLTAAAELVAKAAVVHMGSRSQRAWLAHIERTHSHARTLAGTTHDEAERSAMRRFPSADCGQPTDFLVAVARAARGPRTARLNVLAGSIVIAYVAAGRCMAGDVAHGLTQCYRALGASKANRWTVIALTPPLSCSEIVERRAACGSQVVQDFLTQCDALLAAELQPPPEEPADSSEPAQTLPSHQPPTAEAAPEALGQAKGQRQPLLLTPPKPPEHEEQPAVAPSIVTLARAAQFASAAVRIDADSQWDALSPRLLRRITRRLRPRLASNDWKLVSHAALELLALFLRTNPKAARLLQTNRRSLAGVDLYLHLDRGWICWRQDAYTHAAYPVTGELRADGAIWNYVPLPAALMCALRRLAAQAHDAGTIDGLLGWAWGPDGIDLAACNRMLLDLGDPAHKAEPTRFVMSLGRAFIYVTGSDLLAAFCTLRFDLVTASALNYYSPRPDFIHAQCKRVYSWLGLGDPEPLTGAPERMGARRVIAQAQVHAGWRLTINQVLSNHAALRRKCTAAEAVRAFRAVAVRCAALATIVDGGRGTKQETATVAAVMGYGGVYIKDDKDVDGHSLPRLLPHTSLSIAVVKIYFDAQRLLCKRLGIEAPPIRPEDVVYQMVELDSVSMSSWRPVTAADVSALIKHNFDADLNFARHLWVTCAAEEL